MPTLLEAEHVDVEAKRAVHVGNEAAATTFTTKLLRSAVSYNPR
jgi:hypothetical protein